MFQPVVEYYCGMAVETPWTNPDYYSKELGLDGEEFKDNSPLAQAARTAKIKITAWDVRGVMIDIRQSVQNAPNIDPDNELDAVHCVPPEKLWRLLNGFPDGELRPGLVPVVDIQEVYSLKRAVASLFESGRGGTP